MMASLFLSRVLGIIRDMIMAWQFGQNSSTDAYRLAFQIPDLLFFLVAGGALSSAFIPVFSEYLHTNREKEAWKLFSVVTTLMSIIVLAFIIFAWIFATPLASLIAGNKQHLVPLVVVMSRIVLPAQFAFFVGGLMFGTLYSRQVFSIPGLGPNIYNIGIIFGALVLSQFFVPGVIGMSWGALIGAMLGSFLVPLWAMRRLGSHFEPSLDLSHPGVKKVFRLMAPVVLGLSLPGVYALIMQYFATFYPIEGVNTALDSGNRLMQAPLGIFGQSLALAAFPALAQFFAQDRMDLYRGQLGRTVRTVIYLSMPVSALLIAVPRPIISLVFQHGRFTAQNTAMTASCVRMFGIGIVAWCVHPVLMRGYFAMHKSVKPIVMGTITTLVFVFLSWVFISLGMSFQSLALSGSLAAIFLAVTMCVGLSKDIGGLDLAGIAGAFGKTALASAIPGAILLALTLALPSLHSRLAEGIALATLILAFAWSYYGLTRVLGMPEADTVDRALARLSRKTK